MSEAATLVFGSWREAIAPAPSIGLEQWANDYRYLARQGSAEYGKFDMSRTPFLSGIAAWLSYGSGVEEVYLCKGVQVGATELGNNMLFYYADLYPGPLMGMLPTKELTSRHSKKKVWPGVDATRRLKAKFNPIKNGVTNSSSTLEMVFPGGSISWLWSESKSNFASLTYKVILASDIDRWPDDVEGEGDPVGLIKKRATTYRDKRKLFFESSPTKKGRSKIYAETLNGDQNRYFMSCPHCGEKFTFLREGFVYAYDKETYLLNDDVTYACPNNGCIISEHDKFAIMDPSAGAKWMPTNPDRATPTKRTAFLPSYFSPWVEWNEIFAEYLVALEDLEKRGKHTKMKVWYNTIDASEYDDGTGAKQIDITVQDLLEKREKIENIPDDVVMLSAGVDTQNGWFEVNVLGWVNANERYIIAQYVIAGDPKYRETQDMLDSLLFDYTFTYVDGAETRIYCSGLDTGGGRTEAIYEYLAARKDKPIYGVKGGNAVDTPLVPRSAATSIKTKTNKDIKLYILGVNSGKDDVIADLLDEESRYLHIPYDPKRYFEGSGVVSRSGVELAMSDEAYYQQFLVEQTDPKGRWINKHKLPNEALDTHVYAVAAVKIHRNVLRQKRIMALNLDLLAERKQRLGLVGQKPTLRRRRRRGMISRGVR